jgi:nickel/cobalt transporter (NiCoT) family protein
MQEGQRPLSVGFFFSLGHSTIVVFASLVVYLTATVVASQFDAIKSVGGIVGTSISAFFLIAIALVNIVILRGVWQTFQKVRKGGAYTDQSPDMLMGGGIMARIFRPLFRMISRPWHPKTACYEIL